MGTGLQRWERKSYPWATSTELTQVVIVFLLPLFRQGSALSICSGDPPRHPEGTRLYLTPRTSQASVGTHQHLPDTPPPPGTANFGTRRHCQLWGWGRTCQFSLLGEVSRAGAASDTHEGGSHLGVPAIDIHVTAGHRQLKTRGTGRLAPSRNTGVGFKPGWLASGM